MWNEIRVRGGVDDGMILKAPGEPPSFRGEGPGDVVYEKTGQHDASGRRVYSPRGEPWRDNETLGWTAAPGVSVASEVLPCPGSAAPSGWHVAVSANRHVIVVMVPVEEFCAGRHFARLDAVACRVLRANHQVRRCTLRRSA